MLKSQVLASLFSILLLTEVAFATQPNVDPLLPVKDKSTLEKIFQEIRNAMANLAKDSENTMSQAVYQVMFGANLMTNMCNAQPSLSSSFIVPMLIALVITLSLGVLKYMLGSLAGKFFIGMDPRAELSLSLEHTFVTILLIVAFLVIYNIFSIHTFVLKGLNYVESVMGTLSSRAALLAIVLEFLFAISNLLSIDFPVNVNASVHVPIAVGQLVRPFIELFSLFANFISFAFVEWAGKFFLLCFFNYVGITLLIPVGFVFRSLKITEGLGNSLIAISMAFSLLYPILLSANYELYKTVIGDPGSTSLTNLRGDVIRGFTSFIASSIVIFASAGVLSLATSAASNALSYVPSSTISRLAVAAADFTTNLISSAAKGSKLAYLMLLGGMAMSWLLLVLEELSIIMIFFGLFLTLLNLYIVLSFAYELSKPLKTPLELSVFMRWL